MVAHADAIFHDIFAGGLRCFQALYTLLQLYTPLYIINFLLRLGAFEWRHGALALPSLCIFIKGVSVVRPSVRPKRREEEGSTVAVFAIVLSFSVSGVKVWRRTKPPWPFRTKRHSCVPIDVSEKSLSQAIRGFFFALSFIVSIIALGSKMLKNYY